MNVLQQASLSAVAHTLFSPAIIFAVVATIAFSLTVIKPEEILPGEQEGTAGTQAEVIYLPEVLNKAEAMEPNRLFKAGKVDEAFQKAYALADAKPHDVVAIMAAGNVLSQATGKELSNDGFRLLKRCVALAPRSRYVRINFAEKLASRQRYDEAIGQYEQIIKGFPYWPKPRYALADIYLKTNRPGLAAEQLQAALEMEPNNGSARKLRGIALARAGQFRQGFEEFVMGSALEKIHQGLPPDLKQVQTVHGSLLKAEAYFDQELRNRPDDVTSKVMLARIYLYTERYPEAKARLMEARKRAPSDPDIRRSLALVLEKLGEENLALNEFMLSVKLEAAREKLKEEKL